jgi:hypothetical protein
MATIIFHHVPRGVGLSIWRSLQPLGNLCSMRASGADTRQNLPYSLICDELRWDKKQTKLVQEP